MTPPAHSSGELTRSDCPTCATPCLVHGGDEGTYYYTPLDEDSAGAELSRLESDMLDLHDRLVALGYDDGAINAESIGERIDRLGAAIMAARSALDV